MSIRAGGVFVAKSDVTLKDKIALSFVFSQFATEARIGLEQGGNAGFQNLNHPEDIDRNTIAFDITDDPLDINADCLFGGDGVEMYIGDNRVDNGEDLASRLLKLQDFFCKVLSNEKILKIILNINFGKGAEHEFTIVKVGNFQNEMQKLYEKNDNWTPSLKLEIEGSTSQVHLPDGTAVPAGRIWIRNNGTGTFHGYPLQ